MPEDVEAKFIYSNPVVDTVPALTFNETRAWIAQALKQECPNPPRLRPSWRELWWPAVRARLPEPISGIGHGKLAVNCYAGAISVTLEPSDNGVWVSGPLKRHVIGPPAELTAYNEDGVTAVYLRLYWSPWIEEPGRALVEAAVARVLTLGRGWRRNEG
jgi:hypothetical protein